jgi:hypothetical protein
MPVKKSRNNGQWTEARFTSFIKSTLRSATQRWGPKQSALKRARIRRGVYLCEGWGRPEHETPASLPPRAGNKRRRKVAVDHINPVVDPHVGFTTWDDVIERMFVEVEGFQVLCPDCHEEKTKEERAIRNEERRKRTKASS